jgi:non-homologous end joining protein Ku
MAPRAYWKGYLKLSLVLAGVVALTTEQYAVLRRRETEARARG